MYKLEHNTIDILSFLKPRETAYIIQSNYHSCKTSVHFLSFDKEFALKSGINRVGVFKIKKKFK